jgi:hypothetical protein
MINKLLRISLTFYFALLQAQVDSAAKELLRLKDKFKSLLNVDWTPNMSLPQQETGTLASSDASGIDVQIRQCGDKDKVWPQVFFNSSVQLDGNHFIS